MKEASFLGIPLKIHQHCYSYMVADSKQGITPAVGPMGSLLHLQEGREDWKFAASLLCTCHQFHEEASTFFYSKSTVHLYSPSFPVSSYGSLVTHYDITLIKAFFFKCSA